MIISTYILNNATSFTFNFPVYLNNVEIYQLTINARMKIRTYNVESNTTPTTPTTPTTTTTMSGFYLIPPPLSAVGCMYVSIYLCMNS